MVLIRSDKSRRSATPGMGKFPDSSKLLTSWEWEPKTGKISYEGTDKDGKPVKVTYLQSQLNSQPDDVKNKVEPAFVNDNYWLLFPFHAYWDTSATVTDQGMQKLPMGTGSAKLVVGEVSRGGWRLHARGHLGTLRRQRQPGRAICLPPRRAQEAELVIATWTGYKKAGPLLFSTEHRGTADGKPLHIFISDVAVKLTGSDNWINAQ